MTAAAATEQAAPGTPDLLAVPTGAAFTPAYAPSAQTESDEYAVSMLKSAPADLDGQCILQSDAPRPSSSQRAWKAPLVQQDTSGTQHLDQRPPSVAESAEASAFCLPAEQTRGLGAESRSKAEQRPLAAEELSEATSVTTDGTPSKSASAFCLPAEQTRGLGATEQSRSKAEQRPLAAEELSEATSVTTDGTPSKSGRIQRPRSSWARWHGRHGTYDQPAPAITRATLVAAVVQGAWWNIGNLAMQTCATKSKSGKW